MDPPPDLRLLNDQQVPVACMEEFRFFPSYTLQSRNLDIVIASPCSMREEHLGTLDNFACSIISLLKFGTYMLASLGQRLKFARLVLLCSFANQL